MSEICNGTSKKMSNSWLTNITRKFSEESKQVDIF